MSGSTNENIDARLAVIERTVLDIHRRLYGNGQPGEIQSLAGRIAALENWKWWLVGVGGGFGAFGGVLGYILRGL